MYHQLYLFTVNDNDMLCYSTTTMICFFDKRMIRFFGLYWLKLFVKAWGSDNHKNIIYLTWYAFLGFDILCNRLLKKHINLLTKKYIFADYQTKAYHSVLECLYGVLLWLMKATSINRPILATIYVSVTSLRFSSALTYIKNYDLPWPIYF